MTILTGGVLANQPGVWEGWNTVCASCFHVIFIFMRHPLIATGPVFVNEIAGGGSVS